MNTPQKPNILLLEDEPDDSRLIRIALRKSGFDVNLHVAKDCNEALAFLSNDDGESNNQRPFRNPNRPDLILLKIKLPGRCGFEFIAALKDDNALRCIPVVVLTSSLNSVDVRAAYQLGAAGYIQKPADINEFFSTISRMARYWFGGVRLPRHVE